MPHNLEAVNRDAPIVIAVVDDGVRVSHNDLREFIWINPAEKPGNRLDDDGNGYTDDTLGWDVSDGDNTVDPPVSGPDFYHGTYVAGIVAQVARRAYGDAASDYIKIMPIKVVKDSAQTTYLKQAYKGIEYAIAAGADIILCAWGMGVITDEESRILQQAVDKGILIVASAGNFPEERNQYPAAHPGVIAVASLDSDGHKSDISNFGPFVDLAAPGDGITAAGVTSDGAYQTRDGTSGAAALVAAGAAVVKVQHPQYSAEEVEACLISSAQPVNGIAAKEQAKMGAGRLDLAAAIDCNLLASGSQGSNHLVQAKGYLRPASQTDSPVTWAINPEGDIKGIRFFKVFNRQDTALGTVEFRHNASAGAEILSSYALAELPDSLYVAGNSAFVEYQAAGDGQPDWLLQYEVDSVDARTRYCSGTTFLSEEGVLNDGSGAEQYSYHTNCKWLITAPPGKLIHFKFSQLDTQSQNDMVMFFNGAGTHEDIMAKFRGNELPPELTTWSNTVLVWFVTDGQTQGQGWSAEYYFVDP